MGRFAPVTSDHTTPATPPAPTGAPAPRAGRYANVQAGGQRDPFPRVGRYTYAYLGSEQGYNEGNDSTSHKARFRVEYADPNNVNGDRVGDVIGFVQRVSGPSMQAGLPKVKRMIMAIAGFTSEPAYDAFDPGGELIEALEGTANARIADATQMIGWEVDVQIFDDGVVKDRKTGLPVEPPDFFRGFRWSARPSSP